MTVCIAAIASSGGLPMIITASDRKYTVGDYSYEPFQTKHYAFSNQVVVLFSGTVADHTAMASHAAMNLQKLPGAGVAEVAEYYAKAFSEYRRREAERSLLMPWGLTMKRLATDASIPESAVIRLTREMRRWELEDAAIVAGMDSQGQAHIYRILDPGWSSCEDTVGFTAIGAGEHHAMAGFM